MKSFWLKVVVVLACMDGIEIMLVQDVTETFHNDLNSALNLFSTWISTVQEMFISSRFGYVTFTDKALPYSGFGEYGGWQNTDIQTDWCYSLEQPLVESAEKFIDSWQKLFYKRGSGFDWPESQLETLLRTASDPLVTWSHQSKLKVIVLITDVSSHLPGDAADNIKAYNQAVRLASSGMTAGGWGSHEFGDTDLVPQQFRDPYDSLADLIVLKKWQPSSLTTQNKEDIKNLTNYFGPDKYPNVVPHPGDDSLPCHLTDYPEPQLVAQTLTDSNIVPIVLITTTKTHGPEEDCLPSINLLDLASCPKMFYSQWMANGNIRGLVQDFPTLNSNEALNNLVQSIVDTHSIICPTTQVAATTTKDFTSGSNHLRTTTQAPPISLPEIIGQTSFTESYIETTQNGTPEPRTLITNKPDLITTTVFMTSPTPATQSSATTPPDIAKTRPLVSVTAANDQSEPVKTTRPDIATTRPLVSAVAATVFSEAVKINRPEIARTRPLVTATAATQQSEMVKTTRRDIATTRPLVTATAATRPLSTKSKDFTTTTATTVSNTPVYLEATSKVHRNSSTLAFVGPTKAESRHGSYEFYTEAALTYTGGKIDVVWIYNGS